MSGRVVYRGRVASANPNAVGSHHFRATSLIGLEERRQISEWCEENFGKSWSWSWGGLSHVRWYKSNATWVVQSDEDAMVFRLRWC